MKNTKRYRKPETLQPRTAGLAAARKYETKLDEKKRIVLRGAQYKYYEVNEKENGSIVLTPKKLVDIEPVSPRSMAMLESAAANFKKGIVSEVVDLSKYRRQLSSKSSRAKVRVAERKAAR